MNEITRPESAAQAGASKTDLKHAALSPAQEMEITAKVAKAAALGFPEFQRQAMEKRIFHEWFERAQHKVLHSPDQITPEVRAAFMVAWEKDLRDDFAYKNLMAALDAADAEDDERVHHDRESEDEDDGGGDDEEDEDIPPDPPVSHGAASYLAPAPSHGEDIPPAPRGGPTGRYDVMTNEFILADDQDPRTVDQIEGPEIKLGENDPREPIFAAWGDRFTELPQRLQSYWQLTHRMDVVTGGENIMLAWLEPSQGVSIKPEVTANEAWRRFETYTDRTRRMLAAHLPRPARDLDDIEAPTKSEYVVPGLIPYGLSVIHGDAGACKSLWLQKLALVVADKDGATFEGIEVENGQVLYATLDPSAPPEAIKPGMRAIRDRLGLQPSGRLAIVGPSLYLNDPSSVARWLELNAARLPCKLIVVDSLFSAVTDRSSLVQDTVVNAAMRGVERLLMECDAVAIAHHDNKGGDIFGSMYLTAMTAGKASVVRPLKDGRAGNRVTVTVERLKFEQPTLKLAYTLEGPFLDAGESADSDRAKPKSIRHADAYARLPVTARPIKGTRPTELSEKQWQRLRNEWEAEGLIEQTPKGHPTMIRRIAGRI